MNQNKANEGEFITKERLFDRRCENYESTRGRLLIAGCCSGSYLSRAVVQRYRESLAESGSEDKVIYLDEIDRTFSDSETCVRLDIHVGGTDVFLFQSLFDPIAKCSVNQNYMSFLIATRAFREHGANHVTAGNTVIHSELALGRLKRWQT